MVYVVEDFFSNQAKVLGKTHLHNKLSVEFKIKKM